MLDIALIRENPEHVERALAKRGIHVDMREFLTLDVEYRQVKLEAENLRAERNKLSKTIASAQVTDAAELQQRSREVGNSLAALEVKLTELRKARDNFLAPLPNLPDDDVLAGGKENNEVIRVVRQQPSFDFPALDHVQLAENLNLIDYPRGVKLGGSGFWIYRGQGAMLEWALLNYFVEEHRENGYEFILPPHILGYESGYVAGQFPKFLDDVFTVNHATGGSAHFLIPTAETALVNMHRDETLSERELPKKYFAYSPSYRREAGGYRSSEKCTVRGHQFQKVEMFQFTRPQDSDTALIELLEQAERLVSNLGLHYRVTHLAAEDLSAAMAKTYDIEIWLPSINAYTEISSASNSRDYQARRGNIRYRTAAGKPEFVHTLNASGLATSRLLPAILEQYQQPDGSVVVPEVLRKWGLGESLSRI